MIFIYLFDGVCFLGVVVGRGFVVGWGVVVLFLGEEDFLVKGWEGVIIIVGGWMVVLLVEICREEILLVIWWERDWECGFLLEGGCVEVVVDWIVGGVGEVGWEGWLRMGRVWRVFIFGNFLKIYVYIDWKRLMILMWYVN